MKLKEPISVTSVPDDKLNPFAYESSSDEDIPLGKIVSLSIDFTLY